MAKDDSVMGMGNLVEFAMGLSMASLFSRAMNDTFDNRARQADNSQLATAHKYIYAIVDGRQQGPFSLAETVDMIKAGTIKEDTYIWKQGMPDWMPAKDVTDIAPNLSMVPPPAPAK